MAFDALTQALGLPQGFLNRMSPFSLLQTLNPQPQPGTNQFQPSPMGQPQAPGMPMSGFPMPPGAATFPPVPPGTPIPGTSPLPNPLMAMGGGMGVGGLPPQLLALLGQGGGGFPGGGPPGFPGGGPPMMNPMQQAIMGGPGAGGLGRINPSQLLQGITSLPLGSLSSAIPPVPPPPPMPPPMGPPGMGRPPLRPRPQNRMGQGAPPMMR